MEIYIEWHGSRKLFTRSCSYLFDVDGERFESERIEFFFFWNFFFFGVVLSLARWMERRVSFGQFCATGIFINLYSSRILKIFREFLRDYAYIFSFFFFCGKIELFYFALSEKCLSKILAIRNFIAVFLRFHNF